DHGRRAPGDLHLPDRVHASVLASLRRRWNACDIPSKTRPDALCNPASRIGPAAPSVARRSPLCGSPMAATFQTSISSRSIRQPPSAMSVFTKVSHAELREFLKQYPVAELIGF